jgi:hypothetical protein
MVLRVVWRRDRRQGDRSHPEVVFCFVSAAGVGAASRGGIGSFRRRSDALAGVLVAYRRRR